MTSTLQPLNDRVVLRLAEAAKVSPGGIHIPETARDERATRPAIVVAVGPGRVLDSGRRLEPTVKRDDRVLIGRYTGDTIKIGDVEHVVVHESDILAVEMD